MHDSGYAKQVNQAGCMQNNDGKLRPECTYIDYFIILISNKLCSEEWNS